MAVRQILVSAEMTGGESANLVPVERLKAKAETDPIEVEGLHCVFQTLGDDKEELRAVVVSERETEPLNERPEQRPTRNAARLVCQSKLHALDRVIQECFTSTHVLTFSINSNSILSIFKEGLFLSAILPSLLTRNRWLSLSSL